MTFSPESIPAWAYGLAFVVYVVAREVIPRVRRFWREWREREATESALAERAASGMIKRLEEALEHERERRHEAEKKFTEAVRRIATLEGEAEAKDRRIERLEEEMDDLKAAIRVLQGGTPAHGIDRATA